MYKYYRKIFETQIDFLNNLSTKQKNLLACFTPVGMSDGYEVFVGDCNIDRDILSNLSKFLKNAENIFKKIPPFKEDIILYRGISAWDNRNVPDFKIGEIIDLNIYTHSSIYKELASRYADRYYKSVLFKIFVKKENNNKLLPLLYLLGEIIIDKNHKLQIIKIRKYRKTLFIDCNLL